MKVKITKIKQIINTHISTQKVGEEIVGEISSFAEICIGNTLILKNAYNEDLPKEIFKERIITQCITKVISHNEFETDYAKYKIEEL